MMPAVPLRFDFVCVRRADGGNCPFAEGSSRSPNAVGYLRCAAHAESACRAPTIDCIKPMRAGISSRWTTPPILTRLSRLVKSSKCARPP
jgi:hypothetical protein